MDEDSAAADTPIEGGDSSAVLEDEMSPSAIENNESENVDLDATRDEEQEGNVNEDDAGVLEQSDAQEDLNNNEISAVEETGDNNEDGEDRAVVEEEEGEEPFQGEEDHGAEDAAMMGEDSNFNVDESNIVGNEQSTFEDSRGEEGMQEYLQQQADGYDEGLDQSGYVSAEAMEGMEALNQVLAEQVIAKYSPPEADNEKGLLCDEAAITMFNDTCEHLLQSTDATACSIAVLTDDGDVLNFVSGYEKGEDGAAVKAQWTSQPGSRLLIRGSTGDVCFSAVDHAKRVVIDDALQHDKVTWFGEKKGGSFMVVPIGFGVPKSSGRVQGVMVVEVLVPEDSVPILQANSGGVDGYARVLSTGLYQLAARHSELKGIDPPPLPEEEEMRLAREQQQREVEEKIAARLQEVGHEMTFDSDDQGGEEEGEQEEEEEDEDEDEETMRARLEEEERYARENEAEMEREQAREAAAARVSKLQEDRTQLIQHNLELQRKLAIYFAARKVEETAAGKEEQERGIADAEERYFSMLKKVSELRTEHSKVHAHYERLAAEMKTRLNEKEATVSGMKEEFQSLRRDAASGSSNLRTGKPISAKLLKQFEVIEEQKDAELEKVRLKNIHLRNQLRKVEQSLRKKEELSNELHLIDFEQLKIENQTLNEKIEERNEELLKLRKKTTTTVQVLTHLKEKLQFVQAENQVLKAQLAELEAELATHRDTLTRTKHERDILRNENTRLRSQSGLIGSNDLLRDFDRRKKEVAAKHEQLRSLKAKQQLLQEQLKIWKKKAQQVGVA